MKLFFEWIVRNTVMCGEAQILLRWHYGCSGNL